MIRCSKMHKYLVTSLIERGPFSTIRACFTNGSRKQYVMKIIQKHKLNRSKVGRMILFNEKCLLPLLNHPHVLRVKEVVESPRQLFVVTHMCKHGDLLDYLDSHTLTQARAVAIMDQVLSGVEYLHSRGICHRDVKLENVFVDDSENVKLADLGFASIVFDGQVSEQRGSMAYVAPEVLTSRCFDGYKADVFSCGVMLYILLTGLMPFDEDEERKDPAFELIKDEAARNLVARMMAKDPDERPTVRECRESVIFAGVEQRNRVKRMKLPSSYDDTQIISQISQMMEIPICEIQERLQEQKMNEEKLFYSLMLEKNGVLRRKGDHLMQLSECQSMPAVRYEARRLRTFCGTSVQVLQAMKEFLKPMNGCITANASHKPKRIVVNRQDEDDIIEFELSDACDGGVATMEIRSSSSDDLTEALVEFIRSQIVAARSESIGLRELHV